MCEKVGPVVKWAGRYYRYYIHYVNQYACGFSSFLALLVFFVYTLKFLIHYFQFVNFTHLFQPSYSPLRGPEKLEYSV